MKAGERAAHRLSRVWASAPTLASPLSLPTPMIEPIVRGDGNAVQGVVLGRCVCASRCAGRSPASRGRLPWRRALLSSAGVLKQPALPHQPPAQLLAPAPLVLGASALQSPYLERSFGSHSSE